MGLRTKMEKSQLIDRLLNENEYLHLEIDDEIKNEILYPSIDFLNEKIEEHPEFNFDKILLIALLLINKINNAQIRITPRILVLTSTILWHSAISRPNDTDYYTQEEIDKKFERSISSARYLRQELGITEKKYNGIDDFFEKLGNAIPLKEQMKTDFEKIPKNNYILVKNFIAEKLIGRKRAQSAIECSTFLYFNKEKLYSKNEIWYAVEDNFNLEGLTPRASFNSDISRYTENAQVKVKRKPLLFTIINLEDKEHRIQLIPEIREKIDKYIESKVLLEKGPPIIVEKKEEKQPLVSTHNLNVYKLAKTGNLLGCDVWIAKDLKNIEVEGKKLSEFSLEDLVIPGLTRNILNILKGIDVLWLRNNEYVIAGFEVEHTTQIYSGLLRFSDLFLSIPSLTMSAYIIAPDKRKQQVETQFKRITFKHLFSQVSSKINVIYYSAFNLGYNSIESIYKQGGNYSIQKFLDNCKNNKWKEYL